MKRFLKIAKDLGWYQVDKDIMVFKKQDRDGYFNINFVTCDSYDNFDLDDTRIDETFVNNYLCKIGCCNKVKLESLVWGIPLLISDYFGHRGDREKEIEWAKKAIEIKPDLLPNGFPSYLVSSL